MPYAVALIFGIECATLSIMTTLQTEKRIRLRKNEDHRIRSGHPWVFSNEVVETIGAPSAGDQVEVLSSAGRSLGTGLYHPHSLIAVRICAASNQPIDRSFFVKRLQEAEALRRAALPGSTTYRWVNGESDLLPGLIVDRYDSAIVLQTFAYGMDIRLGGDLRCNRGVCASGVHY